MKKRLLLLIIVLCAFFKIQAQDQYYLQYNFSFEFNSNCLLDTEDGEYVDVKIYNENNNIMASYSLDLGDNNVVSIVYNNGIDTYSSSSEIIIFNERPYRIIADYTSGCDDGTNNSYNVFDFDLVFNHGDFHDFDSQNTNYSVGISSSIDATIGPVLNNPDDNNICQDDLIYTNSDFSEAPEFVNGLTWYYYNTNNVPAELNNYSSYYPLKYSVEQIIGNNYVSQIGTGALKLQYKYQYTASSYELESEIIVIDITESSPEITGFSSTNPPCSYAPLNTGNFTITFGRALNPGEILTTVTLFHDGPDDDIDTDDDVIVSTLFNQTYTGMTYTWPNVLPADQYRLEYQSGNNFISSLYCLVEYSPIIINSPVPVTFSASWTDVNCFGDNTGSISITAGGGQGNYDYSINNGANWFPFSSATTHNVTNLVASNYQVKVRDSNNCIAQQ